MHFPVQSVPMYSPKKIVQIIKSITGPHLRSEKKNLWGQFWSDSYFVSTIGQHGNEDSIKKYIRQRYSIRQ